MSTPNEDNRTLPLSGIAADPPTDARKSEKENGHFISTPAEGVISPALQALKDAPPLDWETPSDDQKTTAADRARFEDVKARVIDSDSKVLPPAQFTHNVAQEQQVATSADKQNEATSPAKRPRRARTARQATTKSSAQDKVDSVLEDKTSDLVSARGTSAATETAEVQKQEAESTKPKRASRRRSAPPPSSGVNKIGVKVDIPAITSEAIEFLGNEDAKAVELFTLSAESQAFVQYHLKQMHSLEQNSKLMNAFLKATARPVSPAFGKFVDALAKVAKERSVRSASAMKPKTVGLVKHEVTERPAASFAPKRDTVTSYMPSSLELRNLDININAVNAAMAKNSAGLENSIEPSAVLLRAAAVENRQEQAASLGSATPLGDKSLSDPLPGPGLGQRLLRSVSNWLLEANKKDSVSSRMTATLSAITSPTALVAPPTPMADKANAVPEAVARRFLKVEQQYYFPDKTPAFADRGNKLTTHGTNPEVVRSLVEIAMARGWDNITVKGTEEFRRSAWMEAAWNGMKVAGYQPTPLDLAELANKPASNSIEQGMSIGRNPVTEAPTQQTTTKVTKASPIKDTAAEPRRVPTQATKGDPDLAQKVKSFQNDKATFVVKKYPDLAGAYGLIEAAKTFATENLPAEARDEFVGMARRHVIQKITAGEQVNGPKVFIGPANAKDSAEQSTAAKLIDLGKSPRAKQVARDR